MPNFPISIDNADPGADYYATHLLNPTGEGGIHAAYGGLIRDRPLPRPPLPGADWRDVDLRTEINQAKSVGIDGFAVDIILPRATSDVPMRMLAAAKTVGGFAVLPTADMAGPLNTLSAQVFAAEFAPYLSAPAAFRLADGRPVLGAFYAEGQPVAWWTAVLAELKSSHGLTVAFVPTFLDAPANMDAFAPISHGFGNWGGRNPNAVPTVALAPPYPVNLVQRAHALGKIWMQPVAYQDNRPREGIYDESANGTTVRNMWQIAIDQQAEWVQLITWNDYAETTQLAPSVVQGHRMLDMNAYWLARYKFGQTPRVLRDALYVSHRIQPVGARPTFPQSRLMGLRPGSIAGRDAVEVVSFAVAPSTLQVMIGSTSGSCVVPAGLGVCTFPLQPGGVVAGLWRDGRWTAIAQSPLAVTATPYVQDLQYTVAGGLR
jgi:Glycosyl hydrolase family 71